MLKKSVSLILCCCMVLTLAGCDLFTNNENPADGSYTQIEDKTPEKALQINPLTGLATLTSDQVNARPIAVMVNNLKVAWDVQKGLSKADIVYETYAEGGVTRLMAVYKDINKADNIGTIRSARYTYVDLAAGHDAIYVHCGLDPEYCKARIDAINMDDFDINSGTASNYGFRIKNGKDYEHTMYTSGAKLSEGIKQLKRRTTTQKPEWASFYDANAPQTPSGGACDKLTVPMSEKTYVSTFTFDASTGKYLKTQGGLVHRDHGNDQQLTVTNVLVLFTSVSTFSDNYHMNIGLTGGTGYYISNGGYVKINWQKGTTASNPMTFTNLDGTELKLNAGNSWVFLARTAVESQLKLEARLSTSSTTDAD